MFALILTLNIGDFFWNILYTAKILSKYRGKNKIKLKDINLACGLFNKKIEIKINKVFRNDLFTNDKEVLNLKKHTRRFKKPDDQKKRSFKTNNLRIV